MRSHLKHFSYFPLNDFSRITTICILALKRSKVRRLKVYTKRVLGETSKNSFVFFENVYYIRMGSACACCRHC